MKRSLIAALLASTAICAIPQHNADAVIPVIDSTANSTLATQLAQQIKMVADMAQQISQLTQLVSLATVAGTMLGDTVDPALTGVFNDLQSAYSNSMNSYGSIMRAPEKIDQELALFSPPPGQSWSDMSFPQLVSRAKRINELTKGTNSAVVSAQADLLEKRVQLAREQANANRMADTSVSALSATQAVAQQMRVTGQILKNIEQSSGDMATIVAEKATGEQAEREMARELAVKDYLQRHMQADAPAGTMSSNPIMWGQ